MGGRWFTAGPSPTTKANRTIFRMNEQVFLDDQAAAEGLQPRRDKLLGIELLSLIHRFLLNQSTARAVSQKEAS